MARRGQRADAVHAAACRQGRKNKIVMAETQTPNFKWTKPDIGGDSSNWGNVLNTTIDAIDSVVWANQQAGVPIGSVTMYAGFTRAGQLVWCDGSVSLDTDLRRAVRGYRLHLRRQGANSQPVPNLFRSQLRLCATRTLGATRRQATYTLSCDDDAAPHASDRPDAAQPQRLRRTPHIPHHRRPAAIGTASSQAPMCMARTPCEGGRRCCRTAPAGERRQPEHQATPTRLEPASTIDGVGNLGGNTDTQQPGVGVNATARTSTIATTAAAGAAHNNMPPFSPSTSSFGICRCPMSVSFARLRFLQASSPRRRSNNGLRIGPKPILMRWVEGQMTPVGGQAQFNYTFASRSKRIHGWFDLDQIYHIAYLCEEHLYVDTNGTLTDISPTPPLVAPTPVGEGGYNDDTYNTGTYGTPRSISATAAQDKVPSAYSLDNFGSILYAMTLGRRAPVDVGSGSWRRSCGAACRRGPRPRAARPLLRRHQRTFHYDLRLGIRWHGRRRQAESLRMVRSGEPRRVGLFQRHQRRLAFSTSSRRARSSAPSATRNGVLFFTAKKAYNSQFLGLPYIYNYVELGNNCTPWSPQSISGTSSMTVWMSKQGLFAFDGTSILPMNCMVRPWVDDDIDLLQVREQACMVHVGDFNEVWWFFPQNGQTKNTPMHNLQLQRGLVGHGADGAHGRHHLVLHRAHHHGRRHGRLSA